MVCITKALHSNMLSQTFALATLLMIGAPTLAQGVGEIEEIPISASSFTERRMDVPFPSTVVDRDELKIAGTPSAVQIITIQKQYHFGIQKQADSFGSITPFDLRELRNSRSLGLIVGTWRVISALPVKAGLSFANRHTSSADKPLSKIFEYGNRPTVVSLKFDTPTKNIYTAYGFSGGYGFSRGIGFLDMDELCLIKRF